MDPFAPVPVAPAGARPRAVGLVAASIAILAVALGAGVAGRWYVLGAVLLAAGLVGAGVSGLIAALRRERRAAVLRAEQLEALQRRLRTAADAAPIGVATLDLDGRYRFVNAAYCEIAGHGETELLGLTFRDVTHPDDVAAGEAATARLLADEDDAFQIEKRYVQPGGDVRTCVLSCTLMRTDDGVPDGLLVHVQDITGLRRAEQRAASTAEALSEVARVNREIAAGNEARPTVCAAAMRVAGATLATLFEPDGAGGLVGTASAGRPVPAGTRIALGEETSGAAVAYLSGRRFYVPDVRRNPAVSRRLADRTGAVAVAFEPVRRGADVVGVLVVGWDRCLDDEEARVQRAELELFASEAALAIEHGDATRRLEIAASTDALTGLPNRRAWDERAASELDRAMRAGEPVAAAMLDLDRFKAYNDRHGHRAGDLLLKAVAAAWRAELRAHDLLARYGGEEFAVLLPGCDVEQAREICERLRAAVPLGQSASCGLAAWDGTEQVPELLERADAALYAAKDAGRDRTVLA